MCVSSEHMPVHEYWTNLGSHLFDPGHDNIEKTVVDLDLCDVGELSFVVGNGDGAKVGGINDFLLGLYYYFSDKNIVIWLVLL